MSLLPESKDFIIKNLGFVLLLCFISVGAIGGCNNNNGEQNDARAITEKEFAGDTNRFANPEKNVVVSFLEPGDAPQADNLTGSIGIDVIPYKYRRSINNTFCFEDDNDESLHFMILQNSQGEEVLSVQANGDCVTEVIQPGEYEIVLTHGEHVDQKQPIFLIPTLENGQATRIYKPIPSGFAGFLKSIHNFLTLPAIAQTDTSLNVTTLLSTNACVDCDLSGVDLTGEDLTFADLSGADLSGANLSGIELFEALLVGAILSGANLSNTDLRGADLTGADLTNANLIGAILRLAILNAANLTGADITNADFENADLRNATWIDGSTCNISSIGACNISNGDLSPCESLTLGPTHDFNVAFKCLLPTVEKEVCADPCPIDPELIVPGCGECTMIDPEDMVISADLVDILNQVNSTFSVDLDTDTPMAIMAWGGEGGVGSNELITSGGDGGASGFASTVTTLSGFQSSFGQTTFFYYLAQAGTLSNVDGDGGSSTLVMLVESSPGSLDDMLLIAGGGAGGESASLISDGADGGQGGIAASSQIGQGFIGVGQGIIGGADGGSTDGTGIGGNGTNDGKDGIGGQGGQGFLGANSEWVNGDPGVGSDGRGGNADDGFSSSGGGGGGGGLGGGGAGDGEPGAGGGSWSVIPTISCNSAPNNDAVPSNPGTIRDDLFNNSNGAVEVWFFPDGC